MSFLQITVVLVISNDMVHCSPVIRQDGEDQPEELPHYYLGEHEVQTERISMLDSLKYNTLSDADKAAIIKSSTLSPLRIVRVFMQMFVNPFLAQYKVIGGSSPFAATGSALDYFGRQIKSFFGNYLLMGKRTS